MLFETTNLFWGYASWGMLLFVLLLGLPIFLITAVAALCVSVLLLYFSGRLDLIAPVLSAGAAQMDAGAAGCGGNFGGVRSAGQPNSAPHPLTRTLSRLFFRMPIATTGSCCTSRPMAAGMMGCDPEIRDEIGGWTIWS